MSAADRPQPGSTGGAAEAAAPRHRVLAVDDEESILRALRRELRDQPLQITAFTDPKAALEAIRKEPFDVIISDNRMPGMTGIELLEEAKKIAPDTVRIILTGYTDLESAIGAINKGEINFYIPKPWDRQQLLAHIREGLEKYRLRTANKRLTEELRARNEELAGANETLKQLAERDRMTGLYNHTVFEEHLWRQIRLFRRDKQPFCLALGDVDDFKRVNDVHGHLTGDEVLKGIAAILQGKLREEVDTSYRYGGEEFAILLRATRADDAKMVLERLLNHVRQQTVAAPTGPLSVTISFGVGQYVPDWSAEDFVGRVDQALYAAKHAGKNRVEAVPPAP